jgi:hypothetical protein
MNGDSFQETKKDGAIKGKESSKRQHLICLTPKLLLPLSLSGSRSGRFLLIGLDMRFSLLGLGLVNLLPCIGRGQLA